MASLPERILCLVTDLERAGSEKALVDTVRDAVRGGVNMVQVRAHELSIDALEALTDRILGVAGDEVVTVVNGSPEVAIRSMADGAHFREAERTDRLQIPPQLVVGQSAHSVSAAQASVEAGADYVIVGTVFPSASHPGGAVGGLELVREVARNVSLPVIGIGGITAENAGQVVEAGASGVAVIGAIIEAQQPFEAARTLADAIGLPGKR